MSTSLYGTVKKIGSSQFVFDKIYANRFEMSNHQTTDGIYHGRYILISYNQSGENTYSQGSINIDESHYTISAPAEWRNNYFIDMNTYHNMYDNTVWQKVFEGDRQKYIMVAALNAHAPGLTIDEDYYTFDLVSDNNSALIYYTKDENDLNTIVIHDGQDVKNHRAKKKASYPSPQWKYYSNDSIYHLTMPMPLRVNVGNTPEYFAAGLNAYTHSSASTQDNLETDINYIRWEHITKADEPGHILGADFNFHLPVIGQAVSDTYDAMYGIPMLRDENNHLILDNDGKPQPISGPRPFITYSEETGLPNVSLKEETLEALSQTDFQGLLYILAHIGLRNDDGGQLHYYLSSDWLANHGEFGHIDHRPQKITNIGFNSNGTWAITAVVQP